MELQYAMQLPCQTQPWIIDYRGHPAQVPPVTPRHDYHAAVTPENHYLYNWRPHPLFEQLQYTYPYGTFSQTPTCGSQYPVQNMYHPYSVSLQSAGLPLPPRQSHASATVYERTHSVSPPVNYHHSQPVLQPGNPYHLPLYPTIPSIGLQEPHYVPSSQNFPPPQLLTPPTPGYSESNQLQISPVLTTQNPNSLPHAMYYNAAGYSQPAAPLASCQPSIMSGSAHIYTSGKPSGSATVLQSLCIEPTSISKPPTPAPRSRPTQSLTQSGPDQTSSATALKPPIPAPRNKSTSVVKHAELLQTLVEKPALSFKPPPSTTLFSKVHYFPLNVPSLPPASSKAVDLATCVSEPNPLLLSPTGTTSYAYGISSPVLTLKSASGSPGYEAKTSLLSWTLSTNPVPIPLASNSTLQSAILAIKQNIMSNHPLAVNINVSAMLNVKTKTCGPNLNGPLQICYVLSMYDCYSDSPHSQNVKWLLRPARLKQTKFKSLTCTNVSCASVTVNINVGSTSTGDQPSGPHTKAPDPQAKFHLAMSPNTFTSKCCPMDNDLNHHKISAEADAKQWSILSIIHCYPGY